MDLPVGVIRTQRVLLIHLLYLDYLPISSTGVLVTLGVGDDGVIEDDDATTTACLVTASLQSL